MTDKRVLLQHGAEFSVPGATAHYPPDLTLEPMHLDIALQLDLEAQSAAGTVTHTLRCRKQGTRRLVLHCVEAENLTLDGRGEALTYEYNGQEITVVWERPFELDEERPLAVNYQVTQPWTGLFFSKPDSGYPDAPRYAVTDHETERARHWLPTIDLPSVRPTLSFHLRAKAEYTIVAAGSHVRDEHHEDGTKTSHFELNRRCPSYLTCFIVGEFVRCDDGEHQGKPLAYFGTKPITSAMLQQCFGKTGAMLQWIEQKLDSSLPWPKYFQFAAPGIGGAMENISLVSWDDRWVANDDSYPEMGSVLDVVNLHEMAHTWFGDLVVVRDYAHAWLKESWATYMESCWLEDTKGQDEQRYDLFVCAQQYIQEADEAYKRPLVTRHFNSSWNMYDRHLYPGGAYRLHMLRCELGDEVFWRGTQLYIKRYADHLVETEDFRRVMEEVSGRSLVQWFDQWIYSEGYPDLDVKFSWDAERKQATFEVIQKQTKNPQEPCFKFPLLLSWAHGEVEGSERLNIDRERSMFTVAMNEAPTKVQVNGDGAALCKLSFDPGEKYLRALLTDPRDLLGRIHAGWTMATSGKRAQVEAVRDAYRSEPFWGVRIQFAKALQKAGSEAAVAAVVELLGLEQDPLVLPTLITTAGHYRDARITTALQQRLADGLRPRAREAAYQALGKQRGLAPFETLAEASAKVDIGGFAQSGALLGLGASRHANAPRLLQERLRYGAIDLRARPAGARALGELANHLPPGPRAEAIETLIDLLRDPHSLTARAAANALGLAKANQALAALAAFQKQLSVQEQDEVNRVMLGIQRSASSTKQAPSKDEEELRALLRKLEHRITDLEAKLATKSEAP